MERDYGAQAMERRLWSAGYGAQASRLHKVRGGGCEALLV